MEIFAKRLKEARTGNLLTQQQVADKIGIPLRAYQNYEQYNSSHCEPRQEILVKIADILDVSVDFLLGRKEF